MMKVESRMVGDVVVIALEGELDGQTVPGVQRELDPVMNSQTRVLLDLSRMSYLSSAGLRLLLLLYRQAGRDGTRVALAGVSPQVDEVLVATGFADFFTLVDSVDDGMEVLTR